MCIIKCVIVDIKSIFIVSYASMAEITPADLSKKGAPIRVKSGTCWRQWKWKYGRCDSYCGAVNFCCRDGFPGCPKDLKALLTGKISLRIVF